MNVKPPRTPYSNLHALRPAFEICVEGEPWPVAPGTCRCLRDGTESQWNLLTPWMLLFSHLLLERWNYRLVEKNLLYINLNATPGIDSLVFFYPVSTSVAERTGFPDLCSLVLVLTGIWITIELLEFDTFCRRKLWCSFSIYLTYFKFFFWLQFFSHTLEIFFGVGHGFVLSSRWMGYFSDWKGGYPPSQKFRQHQGKLVFASMF